LPQKKEAALAESKAVLTFTAPHEKCNGIERRKRIKFAAR
jgi:hypothetical protein